MRDVLSQIARIFDPLGLLGPVISKAKFFIQQLWLLKLEWHEKLPVPVAAEWASFVQSLPVLEKLKIPRFVLSENLESIIFSMVLVMRRRRDLVLLLMFL
ncbi:uncharacterized protein TNIN_357491 [Trichonephila inaurata madagascariensis]|uniref:Uncharacterized protein n=1 Tax=Trichonephila inaurata madagascariensis TaxID=2747483 RepID=A0A8X6XMQ6_9ARAC|nr:uncharacterized protein TNIN_357491 [Trichonephila inaurata madagascariensis]